MSGVNPAPRWTWWAFHHLRFFCVNLRKKAFFSYFNRFLTDRSDVRVGQFGFWPRSRFNSQLVIFFLWENFWSWATLKQEGKLDFVEKHVLIGELSNWAFWFVLISKSLKIVTDQFSWGFFSGFGLNYNKKKKTNQQIITLWGFFLLFFVVCFC